MEEWMSTTALNYNADIRMDYKDIENNLKFVGSVNIYTDNQSYNTLCQSTTFDFEILFLK